ncbi:hypothetical protein [Mycobacterium deserti]|uniref:Uncharacterized protein n=1 Tax=Mycobacterium deserti TaxID=2978347 RepID=A0ABT2M8Y6_9MYCO|nr:hypothetical protein [Mycobacterium deserti]MCT7658723.1 hypothetical protein [Mycobacterium deserti]
MTNPVTAVIDYLIDLFGPNPDPQDVRAFVNNPVQAAQAATGQAVTAAQLQTAYTAVAPASAVYGGGDPIEGMQRAVANHNGVAFMPQTEALSNNDTLSHNDTSFMSPETNVVNRAGEDQQQGVGNFDLEFGDITLGDKTTNTASDGGVVNTGNAGDIDTTNVEGDGNVVGDDNENVNTGDVETGDGSPVVIGEDNEVDNENQQAGGDIVQDNEGPVINDVDMSGGNGGGAAGGDGGGGLIGVGNDGGDAAGGAGGSGGGIVINDNDDNSVDASVDNSNQDNSVDNSVDNSQTVDTDVNVSNDVGIF